MQLKKASSRSNTAATGKIGIAAAISLSSLSMIGFDANAADTIDESSSKDGSLAPFMSGWDIDAAVLWYREDMRVQAIEAIIAGHKPLSDSESVNVKVVIDSLSGASASGAVAQPAIQTFTRPSGKGQYKVEAGQVPLDDTFQDTRLSLTAGWSKALNIGSKVNASVYASKEFDYLSLGMSGGVEQGYFKDNTTLSLQAAIGYDLLDAVGGRPVPLSTMAIRKDFADENAFWQAFDASRQSGVGDKRIAELKLGLTQIISKQTLLQVNYGVGYSSGYLTDPYKLISLLNSDGIAESYIYESRPEKRIKHSAFILGKTALRKGVAEYSYRYTHDDWGLDSHAIEARYRYYFSGKSAPFLQFHLRAYQQTGVDFYSPYISQTEPLPEYISADYRIGRMDTWTLGLKAGWRMQDGDEVSVRLEYYRQQPYGNPSSLSGLQGIELYPQLNAALLQFNYSWN
ncbi:DUF3570 domain-containing protein [Shewanella sp.]|uniref:DUF3570 domain-containing protein n=1 Tax=Shewanella sp. TaxID=50422 RepID=UPI0035681D89